jgi:predicted TIM-barrel fold metal-dependent hydrolase
MKSENKNTIIKELENTKLINTHDHIAPQKQIMGIAQNVSYLYDLMLVNNNSGFLSYLPDEVWRTAQFDFGDAMGRKDEKEVDKNDLTAMWNKLSPIIDHARGSNHYRMFMRACADLFDLDFTHIDSEKKFIELSEKLSKSNREEGWYHHVLIDKANIEKTVVIGRSDPDQVEKEFFKAAINFQDFVCGYDGLILQSLEEKYGAKAPDLDAFVDLLDKAFESITRRGAVAIKDALAYARKLDIKNATHRDAKKAFEPVPHNGWAWKSIIGDDITNFQNYMMHRIADYCAKYDIPMQIHTGPPAPADNGNPMYLIEFIENHPDTTFVILHAGGPWAKEFAVFAKYCGHLYIDFAWLLTGFPGPSGTKRLIGDYLEIMPWDKFTWGADCAVVEESYGTLMTAKELLADVLIDKVEDGLFDISKAVEVGRGILRENAETIYKKL